MTRQAPATGIVYGLVDPRDDVIRYIGKTTQALSQRLSGHVSGPAAARVRKWRAELQAAP